MLTHKFSQDNQVKCDHIAGIDLVIKGLILCVCFTHEVGVLDIQQCAVLDVL